MKKTEELLIAFKLKDIVKKFELLTLKTRQNEKNDTKGGRGSAILNRGDQEENR